MSNVVVDKQKIDLLANAIADKSGEAITMTLDEMVEAVDGIQIGGGEPNLQAKTYTVSSAGTSTVTADSGYDGLSEVEVSVPSADPEVTWVNRGFYTESNVRKWHARPACDFPDGVGFGWMDASVVGNYLVCNAVPSNTNITPTESSQTIGGYNYMMEGAVTVNAIPSTYVGSGITRRSSTDLTASGATVTVPSGYYSAQASKAVASGTAGTPTATKGAVSNHSVSVTPSVTNTTGYITGSTKTGTAVTVSASELVSGSETKTENGTYDVTNLASLVVNVPTGGTAQNIYCGRSNPSSSLGENGDLYLMMGGSGTAEKYPANFTATGMNSTNALGNCIGTSAENGTSTSNVYSSGQNVTGHADYTFDLSDIPAGVTISNVSLSVKAHEENASKSECTIQVYSGSTAKGELTTVNGTSNTIYDVDCGSSWTRAELGNFIMRLSLGYYGGLIAGATLTVEYTVAGYALNLVGDENGWSLSGNDIFKKSNGTWSSVSSVDLDDTIRRTT